MRLAKTDVIAGLDATTARELMRSLRTEKSQAANPSQPYRTSEPTARAMASPAETALLPPEDELENSAEMASSAWGAAATTRPMSVISHSQEARGR